jgi:NAD(P)-dependent dehydrogenase (short-subunit alcohol dehydrogenase family)
MKRLSGKVAVITGASSGIGEATARLFVKEGAKVILFARNKERSDKIVKEIGENAFYFQGDVTKEKAVENAVNYAVEKWGKLDCIFNNAGSAGASGPIDTISEEGFDQTINVLLKGVFFGIKHAARIMKPQGFGSIINCSSIAGLSAIGSLQLYGTCKAAVNHLTKMTANELGEYGIRVNSICPGAIITRIWSRGSDIPEKMEQMLRNYFVNMQPIKLTGMPIDIAYAALWLASDEARFVTGHPLVVDGGFSAGYPKEIIQENNEELGRILKGLR